MNGCYQNQFVLILSKWTQHVYFFIHFIHLFPEFLVNVHLSYILRVASIIVHTEIDFHKWVTSAFVDISHLFFKYWFAYIFCEGIVFAFFQFLKEMASIINLPIIFKSLYFVFYSVVNWQAWSLIDWGHFCNIIVCYEWISQFI